MIKIASRITRYLLMFTIICKGTAMNGQSGNNVDEFKMKIGYDSVLTTVDGTKSIVFQKVDPGNWGTIKALDQKPVVDEVTISKKGVTREWVYKQNEDMLNIEMFVSATDHTVAMKRLLNDATATTMRVIPFEKCPYNLGDINVSIIAEDFCRILWTHYNIFYSVKYTGDSLDIEKLCREMQNDAIHLIADDIDRYRPQFDEVVVSSPTIKKGEMVTVYIVPAYGKAFKDRKKDHNSSLSLETNWDANVLSLEKENGFFFRFTGIAEGKETITFILADLDALVCSKHEVAITVSK